MILDLYFYRFNYIFYKLNYFMNFYKSLCFVDFLQIKLFYRIFINSLYFVDFLQMKVIKDCIELVFL